MSMTSTYTEKILELVLKEYLQQGIVPTADMLEEAFDTYTQSHPDMTKPFLLDEDHTVEEYEESSADKYNMFFERTKSDLEAAYTEVWDRTADSMESFDRWRVELEKLKRRLIDLEGRIDALLLLRGDTAGYFAFIEDNFVDLSKVDQDLTTANVDVNSHMVTLNRNLTDVDSINLNDIEATDATFTVLTREYILSSSAAPGASTKQALEDVARPWQHRVRASQPRAKMVGELKVKLTDDADGVEVASIKIKLHSSNTNSAIIITAMYSNDNYNWYNIPADNYTQSVDDVGAWLFTSTRMKWVKFIMTKVGADDIENGQYIYEFGAVWIKFSGKPVYDTTTGNMLVSKELSAYDNNGNRIPFNKLTLQTCQQLPEGTDILYTIKAKNDTAETQELRIDPYTISNPKQPTLLDLGRVTTTEDTSLQLVAKSVSDSQDFFASYNRLLEADKLILIGSDSSTIYYIDATTAANMIEDQVVLYRNIGENGGVSAVADRQVRDAPRGWKYDTTRTYLTTYIIVRNSSGLAIDLGDSWAWLDGRGIKGSVVIPEGTHLFKVHVNNTAELPDGYSSYGTEADLQNDDPLYPYNHKLLIEGVPYASGYTEEKKYLGVDLYCESIAKRVSVFDLLHNIQESDFGKFAVDSLADGKRVIVVQYDPFDSNYGNERFALTYTTDNNMFDRLIFQAQLVNNNADTDTSITPVLTAYRIKLGA